MWTAASFISLESLFTNASLMHFKNLAMQRQEIQNSMEEAGSAQQTFKVSLIICGPWNLNDCICCCVSVCEYASHLICLHENKTALSDVWVFLYRKRCHCSLGYKRGQKRSVFIEEQMKTSKQACLSEHFRRSGEVFLSLWWFSSVSITEPTDLQSC